MADANKKTVLDDTALIIEGIESRICSVRGLRVMLSHDLSELYGVQTKVLLQAVKRNINRFPEDFAFQLTPDEFKILRSHFVTSSWGGTRYASFAFIKKYDAQFKAVFEAIRELMSPPPTPKKRRIGFVQD